MNASRLFVAAMLGSFLASIVPLPALAATTTSAQRLRAMQHQLDVLKHKYDVQERQIKQLERLVLRSHGNLAVAKAKPAAPAQPAPAPAVAARAAAPAPAPQPVAAAPPAPAVSSLGKPAPQTSSEKSIYEQQNALFHHGITLTPGIAYTYADNRFFTLNGFLALGAIFLGNVNVSRQENSLVIPSLTANYGATNRLQFDMTVPYVERASLYSSVGAQNSSALASEKRFFAGGLGDISTGFYYQLRQHRLDSPSVILNMHLAVPTGRSPYGVKIVQDPTNSSLSYPTRLPTGQGVYTLSAGATMIKSVDPAILFGGFNYYHSIPGHFGDISVNAGQVQPGTVAPGDAYSATFGTAFALNDRMSLTFSFQDTMVGPTRVHPNGLAWQSIAGSEINAGVLNIGTTYAINKRVSWQALVGIGVTQDAPNMTLNLRFPENY